MRRPDSLSLLPLALPLQPHPTDTMSLSSSQTPGVTSAKPRIAVLLGDPSGIGPEMAVKLLARQRNLDAARVLLIADPAVLASGERIAGERLNPPRC